MCCGVCSSRVAVQLPALQSCLQALSGTGLYARPLTLLLSACSEVFGRKLLQARKIAQAPTYHWNTTGCACSAWLCAVRSALSSGMPWHCGGLQSQKPIGIGACTFAYTPVKGSPLSGCECLVADSSQRARC